MQQPLSIALIFLLLPSSLVSAASTDCFQPDGGMFLVPESDDTRISDIVKCPPSDQGTTCPVATGGNLFNITSHSTLNITTSSPKDVFDAVTAATCREFPESLTGRVVNQTYGVDPGQSGYYAFRQIQACYSGILKGGCVKDVQDGTAVTACVPQTNSQNISDGIPLLNGTFRFINADSSSRASLAITGSDEVEF